MAKRTKADVWLEGLIGLRLAVRESLDLLDYDKETSIAILEASWENTNPILLEKNCGCK